MFHAIELTKEDRTHDVTIEGGEIFQLTTLTNTSTQKLKFLVESSIFFEEDSKKHVVAIVPAEKTITVNLVFHLVQGVRFSVEPQSNGKLPNEGGLTVSGYYQTMAEDGENDNEESYYDEDHDEDEKPNAVQVESCSDDDCQGHDQNNKMEVDADSSDDMDIDGTDSSANSSSESDVDTKEVQAPSPKKAKITPAKGSDSATEAYIESVEDYLKKMGPTPLCVLGVMVRKPEGVEKRLSLLLREMPNKFIIDKQVCKLAN